MDSIIGNSKFEISISLFGFRISNFMRGEIPMAASSSIPRAVLEQLRRFDTPTVCNVVELFDLRLRTAGYMDARIQACFPKLPPMVGFAATATYRSAAPPRSGDVYAGIADQVAS